MSVDGAHLGLRWRPRNGGDGAFRHVEPAAVQREYDGVSPVIGVELGHYPAHLVLHCLLVNSERCEIWGP